MIRTRLAIRHASIIAGAAKLCAIPKYSQILFSNTSKANVTIPRSNATMKRMRTAIMESRNLSLKDSLVENELYSDISLASTPESFSS